MSKMDGLRAMREARYAEAAKAARTAAAPKATKTAAAPKATKKPAAQPAEVEQPAGAEPADASPCGHRNIGGRTCTREAGHAAKSHRYS